jgi:hypothetical protein
MSFSLSLKQTRLTHVSSSSELSHPKPYFPFYNAPSTKTLPVTPTHALRESKMKSSDYKLFREQQEGS